jgi:hypothetical protein
MDWIGEYINFPTLDIGINAPRMLDEIRTFLKIKKSWTDEQIAERVFYLPNFYPQEYKKKEFNKDKYWVDVACFGAVRPLKNHMLQAVAALDFANKIGKQLRFHINSGRIEMKGDPVMNNLRGLFQHLANKGHQLIGHEWAPREQFLETCSEMDIGLQVSFSETFNIVGADLISQGVPLVGSAEIPWSSRFFNARATESKEITDSLLRTYKFPQTNVWFNQRNLTKYTNKTHDTWVKQFKG